MRKRKKDEKAYTCTLMKRHFRGNGVGDLVTASRVFPVTARVDLQKALDRLVQDNVGSGLYGVHQQWGHDTLVIAKLWVRENYPVLVGPLQYEEIDLGDGYPARCLKEALWLGKVEGTPFAVLLTPQKEYGGSLNAKLLGAMVRGEEG